MGSASSAELDAAASNEGADNDFRNWHFSDMKDRTDDVSSLRDSVAKVPKRRATKFAHYALGIEDTMSKLRYVVLAFVFGFSMAAFAQDMTACPA